MAQGLGKEEGEREEKRWRRERKGREREERASRGLDGGIYRIMPTPVTTVEGVCQ
jgi:hypothetical protein